jgi:hypothetical protein
MNHGTYIGAPLQGGFVTFYQNLSKTNHHNALDCIKNEKERKFRKRNAGMCSLRRHMPKGRRPLPMAA